jgi:hypothetical protein
MNRSPNLCEDTFWRRGRRALSTLVHDADDFVYRARHADVRILFEAASPMSLSVFQPVLDRLQRDPRIAFSFTTSDRSWTADGIYAGTVYEDRAVRAADVRRKKFDAYINTDFWNMTWLPRRMCRIHFFHGVAGKYGLDAPVNIAPVIASFDRLLFPNRDRLDRYADAGLVDRDGPEAALVGYPKVDCLVDGSLNRAAIERSLGLDPGRPTVLYAPTWSPYSSLNTMGVDVIRALGRLDVNVIVKLHDRSYDRTVRGSGGIDWAARLRTVCLETGALLARSADASPYLFAADVIVTDHSSIGFEFMLLDRPIVVLDCPDLLAHARVPPDKRALLRSAARVIASTAAVEEAVEDALSNPLRLSAVRRTIASNLFYSAGSAAARAAQTVYDALSLPVLSSLATSPALSGQPLRISRV